MATSASRPCPCVGSADLIRVVGFAAGAGVTVAWYVLSDHVYSRPLYDFVKAGLLGVLSWSMVAQLPEPSELPSYDDEDVDCSKLFPVVGEDPLEGITEVDPAELAVLADAVLGPVMITVGVERRLFRRGEGRRVQGARFTHTRQGLTSGALEAGLITLTSGVGVVREKLSRG